MAGLKSTHIPYKAAPNALSDLLGGEVDFMSYDVTFLMAQARAGRVRMLALTSATRLSMLPEVPTMAESGFPGYDLTPWFGVVVPAGTAKAIVDKLATWFNQISSSGEARKFLENVLTDPYPGTSESIASLFGMARERRRR